MKVILERFNQVDNKGRNQHSVQTIVKIIPVIHPGDHENGKTTEDDSQSDSDAEQIIQNQRYPDDSSVQYSKRYKKKIDSYGD